MEQYSYTTIWRGVGDKSISSNTRWYKADDVAELARRILDNFDNYNEDREWDLIAELEQIAGGEDGEKC